MTAKSHGRARSHAGCALEQIVRRMPGRVLVNELAQFIVKCLEFFGQPDQMLGDAVAYGARRGLVTIAFGHQHVNDLAAAGDQRG